MNRAVSSFCRIDLPLEQVLPLLHDETSATIELFCEAPHLDLDSDVRPALSMLRTYARDHHLHYTLHAPCFDLNPAAANVGVRTEVQRQYLRAIEIATEMEADQIVVHSGQRSDPRLSAAEARTWVRDLLEALIPHAAAAGTRLALENTGYGPASIITTPADLLEIVEHLPPDLVGLTLDLGHAALQQIDMTQAITAWMPRLCNVHLHDNHAVHDDHLVPGRGNLPLKSALETLEQHGYAGYVVLEAFLGGPQPSTIATAWEGVL